MTIKTVPITKAENEQMNKMINDISKTLAELKDPNKINTAIIGIICNFSANAMMNARKAGAIICKEDANKVFSEYMEEFKAATEHLFDEILQINKIYE